MNVVWYTPQRGISPFRFELSLDIWFSFSFKGLQMLCLKSKQKGFQFFLFGSACSRNQNKKNQVFWVLWEALMLQRKTSFCVVFFYFPRRSLPSTQSLKPPLNRDMRKPSYRATRLLAGDRVPKKMDSISLCCYTG